MENLISHLDSLDFRDMKRWLFETLRGHSIFLESPREEESPSYFVASLYSGLSGSAREDLQRAVLGYLVELGAGGSNEWSTESLHQLLLIVDPVLLNSIHREDSIRALLKLFERTDPEFDHSLGPHYWILQSLIALGYRGDIKFWQTIYDNNGERFAPVVSEGLLRVDVSALFKWLADSPWCDALGAALVGVLPGMLSDELNSKTLACIEKYYKEFGSEAKKVLGDYCAAEGIEIMAAQTAGELAVKEDPDEESDHPILRKDSESVPVAFASHKLADTFKYSVARVLGHDGDLDEDEATRLFHATVRKFNGQDRSEVGALLGRAVGEMEVKGVLRNDAVRSIWRLLGEATKEDKRSNDEFLRGFFLRAKTSELAGNLWIKRSNDVKAAISELRDLKHTARVAMQAVIKADVRRFVIAESQFHEDRLFCDLLVSVLRDVGLPAFRAERKWGSLETRGFDQAEVGFKNQGHVRDDDEEFQFRVYEFSGYYLFARRDWIDALSRDKSLDLPHSVTSEIDNILHGNGAADSEGRSARAWLAVSGGLSVPGGYGFGFPETQQAVQEKAKEIGRVRKLREDYVAGIDYDQRFREFLQGTLNIFMGGAIHSRMLKRWWCNNGDGEIIELLNPKDFQSMLEPAWPLYNVLSFGHRLTEGSKQKDKEKARHKILALYREVGQLLATIGESYDQSDEAKVLLDHLSFKLGPDSNPDNQLREWSFVTDILDTRDMLMKDNTYRLS